MPEAGLGLRDHVQPWAATCRGQRFSAGTCQFCLPLEDLDCCLQAYSPLWEQFAVIHLRDGLTGCLYEYTNLGQSFKAADTKKEIINKHIMTWILSLLVPFPAFVSAASLEVAGMSPKWLFVPIATAKF